MEETKMGIDRKTHRLKEECLARKRNQEYRKQLFWNDITNYYKSWDVQAAKYNVWTTQPPTPTSSDEKNGPSFEKQLEERRTRLSRLLTEEHQQYERPVQCWRKRSDVASARNATKASHHSHASSTTVENVKNVNLESKIREEETRRREARLKKYSQWKISHSEVHNMMDKKKSQESMRNGWNEQMKEKQTQKERERVLAFKLEEENAKRRLLEEQLVKQNLRKKNEEMKQLQSDLLKQMEEVKRKDEMTQKIKQQERQDIKLKQDLEAIAVQRNQIEKHRRSRELYSFLHNQYQLQLKQKTKKIQQELQEDQRFVEEITRCFEQEQMKNHQFHQEARKEIDRANAMLNEFSRLEKQREKEMEFLFFEEAKKLWQKQELRWNAEQEARNNLMRDVLVSVQKQMKEKLEKNAQQHSKLIEEKEQLLKNIESVSAQLKEADVELKNKKERYREELDTQIREKQLAKQSMEQQVLDVESLPSPFSENG